MGKAAKDFAVEQAPILVQEILNWRIYECVFYIGLCSLFVLVSLSVIYFAARWAKKNKESIDHPGVGIPVLFSGIAFISAVAFLFIHIYNLIFVLVAPRMYLLEYFSKLVK